MIKGQFKKGKSDNVWYLIISGNADVLRKFANVWKSIRAKIEENTGGIVQYDKNYTRIKFESSDNLPTDNIVNIHQVTIIIRSVFAQNSKFYPYALKNIAILNAKGNTYKCILMGISKNERLKRLNNSVTYDKGVLEIINN